MFHLILYQPEIPPNTGNIIRLCANTGAGLHLVEPLGFRLDDRELKRAGLDYREYARVRVHADLAACLAALDRPRLFAVSTRGRRRYSQPRYAPGDAFLLGPESRGLPVELLAGLAPDRVLRLPLRPDNRSLNLANAAAVVLYEAWRQLGYDGAE